MAINTSNTVFFKIDPVDFALYQAETQTPEQTSASPAVKTPAASQNKDLFVTFLNDSTSEFANAYPCTFEFEGFQYSDASTCVLERLVTASGKETLNDSLMHVLRAKFGQNPKLKDLLLSTGDAFLVCHDHNFLGTCLMQLRGEYGCTGIIHLTDLYPDIIHLISSHPDIIHQVFSQCVCTSNFGGLFALSCLNRQWNQCSQSFWGRFDLKQICPAGLNIIDAKRLGIKVDDEPSINSLEVLKWFKKLAPHVENEGLTLLTMCKGLTFNLLVEIAAKQGLAVKATTAGLEKLGNVPVVDTYIILITNNVFMKSRGEIYDLQEGLLAEHGCKMPTVLEYVTLCVFTNNLFKQCLYGQAPLTYGRSSTQFGGIQGLPLVVGGFTPTHLYVFVNGSGGFEGCGAGGRREF